jgi:phthalate 4,5-dioxygenase oxygenase subunit
VSEQDAMIQDSQGFIADRTREHLGPTDAAIIEFRRQVLHGARDLAAGVEPAAARAAAAYRVRGGSLIAPRTLSFVDVMTRRFGHPLGLIQPSRP